jgi:hypothetical protein
LLKTGVAQNSVHAERLLIIALGIVFLVIVWTVFRGGSIEEDPTGQANPVTGVSDVR